MSGPLAVALAAVVIGFAALVAVVWMEGKRLRDEQTANRMERAELLTRIQAPHLVATSPAPFIGGGPYVPTVVEATDEGDYDIEREWAASPESQIPFDPDLILADE